MPKPFLGQLLQLSLRSGHPGFLSGSVSGSVEIRGRFRCHGSALIPNHPDLGRSGHEFDSGLFKAFLSPLPVLLQGLPGRRAVLCASVLVRGGGTLAGGRVHVPLATLLLNCEDGLFPLPFWAVDQRGLAIPISILTR